MRAIELAPLKDPFSLMFKNMSFETLSQICRPIWLSCVKLSLSDGMSRLYKKRYEKFSVDRSIDEI